MTLDKANKLINEEYHLDVMSRTADSTILNCVDKRHSVSVTVYVEKDEFQLDYMIPGTTFRVTSDRMGTFSNPERFHHVMSRFILFLPK